MRISPLVLVSSIVLAALSSPAQSTNQLRFPITGFSIAPLETPVGDSPQQPLAMFLPAVDGFAANVNVQVQPYNGTLEDYTALSLQQFKSAGFKVLQQKSLGKSSSSFEYTGEMQGRKLHCYARAEKSVEAVYLVTATAPDNQWSTVSSRLKRCVDSFRREPGGTGVGPNTSGPGR